MADLTSSESIPARLDALPVSRSQRKIATVLSIATFFDSFDALTIAFILPSIMRDWHLPTKSAGALVAAGYVGQAVGALTIGVLAERIGRRRALVLAIVVFSAFSLVSASASTYTFLMIARFFQGIGLGGEVPVAATYLSEMLPSRHRGRMFLTYQSAFGAGMTACAIVGSILVPHFGWRVMFALGGLPLILAIIIRRSCPESPRWLASQGLLAEADAVVQAFEREAPLDKALQQTSLDENDSGLRPRDPKPKGSAMDIFSYRYLVRTLSTCMLWICAYICSYAIALWLPTLFTQVYGLSLQSALNFSILTSAAGALGCGMLSIYVDRIKRPTLLWVGFATTASALLALAVYPVASVGLVIVCCTIAMFFLFLLAGALYLYTPELYPTSSRAAGTGFASIWARIAAMGTPFVMGFLIQQGAARTIFMTLAIVALVGAAVSKMWAVDRTGQSLEA